jgi:hypothetical protein
MDEAEHRLELLFLRRRKQSEQAEHSLLLTHVKPSAMQMRITDIASFWGTHLLKHSISSISFKTRHCQPCQPA